MAPGFECCLVRVGAGTSTFLFQGIHIQLAQGGHTSPAGHFPVTIGQGLCSALSSSFKWKHFKGLCSFFPSPFFFPLQTINYKLKRKFQPSFPTQKFRGNKYKAVQCRNKTVLPVLSEIKAVVVWGLFGFFTSFLESGVS